MKKKLLFIFSLMLFLFSKELMAQLPQASTATIPKWYFIQVVGEGNRTDRVFTVEDNEIYGTQTVTDELSEMDKQLWRFEQTGSIYSIINKATGRKLDIGYNADKGINFALLNDNPSTTWSIEAAGSTSYYNIKANTPTAEKSNAIYAHQADNYGNRNYIIMFESYVWQNSANSLYKFVPYDEQLPQVSSSQNSIWYYIQVLGEGDRMNRVYTAENGQVFGNAIYSTNDFSEMDKQLWRFEQSGSAYAVINKATGKKLDISYNSTKGINVALVNNTPSTNWIIEKSNNSNYFNIKAETPISSRSSHIYSHQANNYDSRNYAIMFETSGYRENANSLYKFIKCDYPVIETSTTNNEVWYTIKSKKPGYTTKCITDVTDQNWAQIKFAIEDVESGNESQYWKVVDKDGTYVQLVNKATGNTIQTDAAYNRYFYAQHAPYSNDASGWIINYLGDNQYEVCGINQNAEKVYLNAASDDSEADIYLEDNNKDSGFAWAFKKITDASQLRTTTGNISIDNEKTDILIYSQNRKIYVEGADNYTIRNISGIVVDNTRELSIGIYLVTVNGKTTKILVK